MSRRLAIVSTHPIQYHAPWFRALEEEPGVFSQVLFCHRATEKDQAEAGFGVEFDWDTPILHGYRHRFLPNRARRPSVSRFWGVDTPSLGEELASGGWDAVLVNGWHYLSAWQAMRACRRLSIPVLMRSDSHLHTRRSLWKRAAKRLPYRHFISRLDACLAVGKWSREYFLHYGASPERIFRVPHVVEMEHFEKGMAAKRPRRVQLRAGWGLPAEALVFLFVGKLLDWKRPLDLLRALQRLEPGRARASVLLVGDGPQREACRHLARQIRLPVALAGFLNQSEIVKAYAAADVLVLPSEGRETWGLVVNEAMACGLPCLVSDQVGSGPDLIREGETGWVFPCGDVQALAASMDRCLEDPQRLQWMADRARRLVRADGAREAVQGVIRAMDSVVGSGK